MLLIFREIGKEEEPVKETAQKIFVQLSVYLSTTCSFWVSILFSFFYSRAPSNCEQKITCRLVPYIFFFL